MNTHTRTLRRSAALLLFLAVAFAQRVYAQAPIRVQWSLRSEPVAALQPGAEVAVTLVAAIDQGWKMYSLTQPSGGPIALRVSVPEGEPFVLAGQVSGPAPSVDHDSALGIPIELHAGTTEFAVPLKVIAPNARGIVEGRIVARYQACSAEICLPPRSVTVPVRLVAASPAARGR